MSHVQPVRMNIMRAAQTVISKGEKSVLDGDLDRFLKNLAWMNAHDLWEAENKGFDGLCDGHLSAFDSSDWGMEPILLSWGIMPEVYATRITSIRDTYVHEFKHELNILMRGE
ncbi:gp084 [Rhodococcus phage ReqiDocB7]|uniref:gp084 n=1 Tax=Rhodococcus phage ReqiDocB7 TaxID=691966 RepID=UPI0001CDD86D|nr:gp084 [Rhodococcus phage ReqiDocB7]ADD80870.1 gp084 [Rhodococcus phage ReqiDocB7]